MGKKTENEIIIPNDILKKYQEMKKREEHRKEYHKQYYLQNKDKKKRYERFYLWRNCLTTLNEGGYLIKKFSVKEIKDISQKMVDKEDEVK